MPRNKSRKSYTQKPGFKRKPKGGSRGSSQQPSQTLDSVLQEDMAVLPSPERETAESSVQKIKKELGLLERITLARAERGIRPSPLEQLVVGTEDKKGVRDLLQDFVKNNPNLFDEGTLEGAAARELYSEAVVIAESALKADTGTAKKLLERLKFIRDIVKEREGSQSVLAKRLEDVIKPVESQLREKTTFKAYLGESFKEFKSTLPERILAQIPGVGGILSDYVRSKREAREDVEDFSGRMLEKISRGGAPRSGELDFDRAGIRGSRAQRPKSAAQIMAEMGRSGELDFDRAGIRGSRAQRPKSAAQIMAEMGGTPASSIMGAGIDSLDPEKNPIGAIYGEVVKIRELMEGKTKPSQDQEKKQRSALDRIKELYDKMFGKKEDSASKTDGGGGLQEAAEDALLKRAGGAASGLFAGLGTPGTAVGSAGAGAIGAYALGGAAIGTAAAYGINKGIDYLSGAKEGEGLADYQMQASTYNPMNILDVGAYSTSVDTEVKHSEEQARGMKPVALQGIEQGYSTASDIARSVRSGVLTESEATSAIKNAQNASPAKYDENFLPFYREVQNSWNSAQDENDLSLFAREYPQLMSKYGYDSESKDQRMDFRGSSLEASPSTKEPSAPPEGTITTISTDNPVGLSVQQAEAQRLAVASAKAEQSAPSSAPTTNNTSISNKSSVINNNFNEDLKIRNNEPTIRQIQRESAWLSRT